MIYILEVANESPKYFLSPESAQRAHAHALSKYGWSQVKLRSEETQDHEYDN